MEQVKITFLPENRTVEVAPGTTVADAARLAGLPLNMQCGGGGKCGKCRAVFVEGAPDASATDDELLGKSAVAGGARLACRAVLHAGAVVRIPEKSRLVSVAAAKESARFITDVTLIPAVRNVELKMHAPHARDTAPDLRRLMHELPGVAAPELRIIRGLPALLREYDFNVAAIIRGNRLLGVSGAKAPLLGAAVDLGTTTIAARVVSLETGEDFGVALAPNPQAAYGADVASRSTWIRENKDGLKKLSGAVAAEVNRLLAAVADQAGQSTDSIVEVLLVGNPTMVQIFLGIDPGPIAVAPFTPAIGAGIDVPAHKAGLKIHEGGRLLTGPAVAGYVGADAVAALLAATAAGDVPLPAVLVDLGTNAEIILVREDGIWACAAAAGPALEGAQLSCGMGAYPGAVDSVKVSAGSVEFTTVGGVPPLGLCGTGALDLLAGLLDAGIIEPSGRFAPRTAWPEEFAPNYYLDNDSRPGFMLECSAAGVPVALKQQDVRQLQLARSAILSGIQVLMSVAGVSAEHLGSILLAGALGTFMKPETALRTGIVPRVPAEKIRFLGNAALEGARRALLNTDERRRAEYLAGKIAYVELSGDALFAHQFERNMTFEKT